MRILHVISGLETGGAETSLTRLVAQTREHEHVVISLTGRGTQADLLEAAGARVYAMNWRRGRVSPAGLRSVAAVMKREQPSVVHAWMYHANLVTLLAASWAGLRNRVVWSIRHSLDEWRDEKPALRIVIRLNAVLSRFVPVVLYNSRRSAEQHRRLGFGGGTSQVIANGFDTVRFSPSPEQRVRTRLTLGIDDETPVVGLVARAHALKDHDTFIRAAALLRAQLPTAKFILAGRGTDDPAGKVQSAIDAHGLQAVVYTLGDRRDVEAIYNACDIVALTSRSEAFPNAIGEAMACGVACSSTDVGDAAWIIGDTGSIVPPGDPVALASSWERLLRESPARAHQRRVEARKRIEEQFSLAQSKNANLAVWRHVSESRQTPDIPGRTPIRVLHVLTASMSLTFLRGQREWFAARGIDLHVACSPGRELDAWEEQFPGTAHTVPMTRSISPIADLISLFRLVRVVRAGRYTVVHAGTPKGGLLGMIAARIARIPTRIYHLRGLPLSTSTGFRKRLLLISEKVAMRCATVSIAVSYSLRAEMEREGLHTGGVRVIGRGSSNGIDARARFNPSRLTREERTSIRLRYNIPPDAPVAGFIGRITRDKGIRELVAAWRTVRSTVADAHLVVVGEADEQNDEIQQAVAALRSDPRVHLHGADWNTPPLYAAIDVLVLPTYREGFPNVLLEASAMRRAVIATLTPGCVDAVVAGSTGLLVPAQNAQALAEAMMHYLSNRSLSREHGANGRTFVLGNFDRHTIWEGYASLYGAPSSPEPAPVDDRLRSIA